MYYRITYIIWEKWGIYHIYTILIGLKEQPSLQSMHVHNSRSVQIGFKKLESINKSDIERKTKSTIHLKVEKFYTTMIVNKDIRDKRAYNRNWN